MSDDDKTVFYLPADAFNKFNSDIAAPPPPNEKLKELLRDDKGDKFVVNRLRTKPVEYTVTISHFVSGGEWQMGVQVQDVGADDTNRERVAADLRHAAEMLENSAIGINK